MHNDKTDEPCQGDGKTDEAAITDRTFESVDYQPNQEHSICSGVGPSLKVADKELVRTLRSFGDSMVEKIQVSMPD